MTPGPSIAPWTIISPRANRRAALEPSNRRLPPGSRQVLVLHDVEGYTHAEIAGLLGVTVGTSDRR